MTSTTTLRRSSTRRRILLSTPSGVYVALLLAGCGGGGTKTVTAASSASTRASYAPAWQPGTAAPKVTGGLIAQARHGLTVANTNLGTVDEVFGAVPADVHVNPSAKTCKDQYTRFGRCMCEYMKIHDLGHELALLWPTTTKTETCKRPLRKPPQSAKEWQ
jgi:hypothetical protein